MIQNQIFLFYAMLSVNAGKKCALFPLGHKIFQPANLVSKENVRNVSTEIHVATLSKYSN